MQKRRRKLLNIFISHLLLKTRDQSLLNLRVEIGVIRSDQQRGKREGGEGEGAEEKRRRRRWRRLRGGRGRVEEEEKKVEKKYKLLS